MTPWRQRRVPAVAATLILAWLGAAYLVAPPPAPPVEAPLVLDTLPSRLSDAEFRKMVEDFSEPDGYFRSDNLLSNESGLQDVIPRLRQRIRPGGVYIGVGPEQNFTYILALEPKISFIVDIRRLNMLEHLLYKSLFELSADRADFVSRLFSRERPPKLGENATVEALFDAYERAAESEELFESNLSAILDHLKGAHQFALSDDDEMQLRYIYSAFYRSGPSLSYSFRGSYYQGTLGMPTYRQLMLDTDAGGYNWGFLAEEDRFRRIQEIQRRNLIVPLVGDFAGPKTLRAVGDYLRRHGAVLSVFYTSNVEMYLFQQGDDWERFYENVATLPTNAAGTFIRFAVNRRTFLDLSMGVLRRRSQVWSPIQDVVDAARSGEIAYYDRVIAMSK